MNYTLRVLILVLPLFLSHNVYAAAAAAASGASSAGSVVEEETIERRDFPVRGRVYTYVPGSLEDKRLHDKETEARYIHPTIPTDVRVGESGAAGGLDMPKKASSLESAPEIVLRKLFKDRDGREPVLSPAGDRLHRVHAQVNIRFEDGDEYGGSGTLVGPRHLLTAGHNLFDPHNGGWAQSIDVRCALDGTYCYFGQQRVIRAYTYKKWIDSQEEDYDMALFVLNKPVGKRIGWYGLAYYPMSQDPRIKERLEGEFYIAGYPMEVSNTRFPGDETAKGREFQKMWRMSNRKEDGTIKSLVIEPTKLRYDIDTSGGQSGSAIWYVQEEAAAAAAAAAAGDEVKRPYVVGIHAYGETDGKTGNYGVRLTRSKFDQVMKWIEDTYEVKEIVVENIPIAPAAVVAAAAENIEDQYRRLERFPSDFLETKIRRGEDIPAAYGVMAERLLYGWGVSTINKAKSFEYATKASAAGDELATAFLSHMYGTGDAPDGQNMEKYSSLKEIVIGILRELSRGDTSFRSKYYISNPFGPRPNMELLRDSAEGGYPRAQVEIGKFLTKREEEDKLKYLEQAAERGDATAMHILAYREGLAESGSTDLKAIQFRLQEFYRKLRPSARKGVDEAQYVLAHTLLNSPVKDDPEIREEAIHNYRLAAKQGHKEAIEALERLGVPIEEEATAAAAAAAAASSGTL